MQLWSLGGCKNSAAGMCQELNWICSLTLEPVTTAGVILQDSGAELHEQESSESVGGGLSETSERWSKVNYSNQVWSTLTLLVGR